MLVTGARTRLLDKARRDGERDPKQQEYSDEAAHREPPFNTGLCLGKIPRWAELWQGFHDRAASRNLRRMCGRYASFLPPELIARLFGTKNPLPNLKPTWNMAPTMDAPVVRRHPETGERHLDALTWGFVPTFTKTLKEARRPVNARAETISSSGMFRHAFVKRRCIVPAAAFYEWQAGPAGQTPAGKTPGGKTPYAIARADGDPLAFAGIWEGWRSPDGNILRTFAIVTTTANPEMAVLHERMPVILEAGDWPVWLGEDPGAPETLLRPSPEGVLRLWQVDRRVGNVRNDDPDLLAPIAA
jgi:putative SOS response-associated peptidase YedK